MRAESKRKAMLVGAAAAAFAIIAAITFNVGKPKPCTGNVMQDDLIACGLELGDQK